MQLYQSYCEEGWSLWNYFDLYTIYYFTQILCSFIITPLINNVHLGHGIQEIHLGYVCQERVNQHEWRISHHYT
jgi:hypothetical protein